MKNIFLLVALFCVSEGAFAHPGLHDHYGFIAFIHHFFTEPDHLLIVATILVVLVLSKPTVHSLLSRLAQKRWFK